MGLALNNEMLQRFLAQNGLLGGGAPTTGAQLPQPRMLGPIGQHAGAALNLAQNPMTAFPQNSRYGALARQMGGAQAPATPPTVGTPQMPTVGINQLYGLLGGF